MIEKEKNTEEKILEAAKKIFIIKGFDGARMQEIANEAQINKALLHYYFRSKDKLFEAVFASVFSHFFPAILEAMQREIPFAEKIKIFVDNYINMLTANPYLPAFIIGEINRNPENVLEMIKKNMGAKPDFLFKIIADEINMGRMRPIDPRHLMINILSLCIFPFIARPIITGLFFENNQEASNGFMEERKNEIVSFIIKSISVRSV